MSRIVAVMDAQRRGRACPRGRPGDTEAPLVHRGGRQDVCFALRFDAILFGETGGSAGGHRAGVTGPQEAGPVGDLQTWGLPPTPCPQNPPPKHVPPKALAPRLGVPRKPGSPRPRAFSRSSLEEKGPSQSTCHALGPLTPHALPWGGGGDGERQWAA